MWVPEEGQQANPRGRARPPAAGEAKGQGGRRTRARRAEGGVAPSPRGRGAKQEMALGEGASGVSVQTRDVLMLAISLLTAASPVFLYVVSVHYRALAAC